MAIGNVGTYGTDKPVMGNPIGDAINAIEQNAFKYRAEQRLAEAKKAKEDEEKLKELEEYNNKFGVNITGNQSIDDTTTQYAMQAKQQANDLTKQIQMTTDFNKKAELMAKRAKIVQSFDILKQVPQMLIAKGEEISKGVKEEKYNDKDVDLIQEKFKSLEQGKVHYYTDDAGNVRITTYKVDDKGAPTGIIDKDQTLAEVITSLTPHLASKYDVNNGIAEQFVTTVKQDENKIQNGLVTTVEKGDLKGRIKRLADLKGREVAEDRNEAFDMWVKMGNPPKNNFDEEDKRKIAYYVSNDLQSRYGKTYEKTIDLAEGRAQRKEAEEKMTIGTAKFGDARSDNFLDVETVEKDSKGNVVKSKHRTVVDGDSVYQNIVTVPEGAVPFKNLGGSRSGLNVGYVEGFTKDKKTGDIVITGKALKTKGVKFKVNDKLVYLDELKKMADDGNYEAKAKLNSYTEGDNYGTFVRRVPQVEVSNLLLKTPIKTISNLNKMLEDMNQGQEEKPAKKTTVIQFDAEGNIIQ